MKVSQRKKRRACSMQVNDNVCMKHFGNFVALLIVAVNALFTGLLLLVAYSPYIQRL